MPDEHRSLKQFLSDLWKSVFASRSQVPWDDNWKLDEKFFNDMGTWKDQHPESTLLKVMEKVNDAVSRSLPFTELVPDAPFPARALVKALAHLLALGVQVSRAKDEVFEFTREVITWVSTVEASFGTRQDRKIVSIARGNLKHVRNLINEICKWGWARLNDGRWTGLINGLAIADEIRVFKEKLTAARELLLNLQVNTLVIGVDTLMVGVDTILAQIGEIKHLQKIQSSAILDHLEEAKAAEERERFLQQTLFKVALSNTAYDDQGKPPCDEDTRVGILADIKEWVDDVSSGGQNFFWLTGDPGCGKSAITASLARYCKDSATLWAQFFIDRNNEATTNPRCYFPSIARQMAEHTTSDRTITKTIYEIIKRGPSVLDQITLNQALVLFVQTVQAACDLDPGKAVVIVIDGLDETQRDKLQDTARIFSQLFKVLKRRNAKVFISSRTDDEITKPFYRSLRCNERHVKHVHLDTSDPSCVDDVSRYLFRNVKQLVENWDLNWEEWPGKERMKMLCVRASGLFIWAVTVVKFFQEQLRQSRHERLNELLDVLNDEGMGDVNQLYEKILEITYAVKTNTKAQNDWEHEKFRWIVGFIVGMTEPLPVRDIGALLDLRQTARSNPVDVVHFVRHLRTVLVAGSGDISNDTIPRLHKSFVEFITSERADVEFRIDARVVDGQIATKCLRLVGRLKNDGARALLPAGSVQYAIQNWSRHLRCRGISETGVGVLGGVAGLLKILSMTTELKMSASGDYRTHIYDPKIGLPLAPNVLVAPPQYSHSSMIRASKAIRSIAVSPDGRLLASAHDNIVELWDSRSHERISGNAGEHDNYVSSVCFSPDSCWLVSGGMDNTVRVWDCGTGKEIGSPLIGHLKWVNSVCTDGQTIVSGSMDRTIRIWSCDTRQAVGEPIDFGDTVLAIALSKDGRIAAGVGPDVCVFDVGTRQQLASMKGHTGPVRAVAFSPEGSQIASGSADKTVCIWNVQTGSQMHRIIAHADLIRSVSFSPDGHWIASGSDDRTVCVCNSQTGKLVGHALKGHTMAVIGVSFLPDTFRLVSGSFDGTIHIWSAPVKWQKPSQQISTIHLSQQPTSSRNNRISLEGHPSVISSCCSPDGSLYAASTLGGHVSILDMDRKLLWETNTSIPPIHLLRFSETQLVLSAPDGSTVSWNLLNGKPTGGGRHYLWTST